ncbi:hypothetical protein SETIT_8G001900v2 [Setaria italica]|uniref:IBR domain-containing protein n=1 Tax=Setaria italica TaxID=4555 RepID=A0A368S2N0_SETIT|nr:hypothetical protein SETIT_8G001900v2 [Setaria italica]
MLHNLMMLGICHPTGEELADVIDQALLAQKKFEQFEISLVRQKQVRYVEGSKVFLPPPVLEMMAQRIREARIPAGEKLYCPYPKCSALLSLSEVQGSSDEYSKKGMMRSKCVRCGGWLCVGCKVAWHEGMSCREYEKRGASRREDAMLEKLAKQRLWQQCGRCNAST